MKKIQIIIIIILIGIIVIYGISKQSSNETNNLEREKTKEVILSEQTKQTIEQTQEATKKHEDLSTKEIPKSTEEEEKEVTDEGALESDAVVEQENISYDGDFTGSGNSLLGAYQGLTYYSQADSRWANIMYSSVGDTSQTMKTSSCGPTAAAIVVSSSKGTILPTVMANLAVDNGYRTAKNGTAWSYYSFVADYFDFNEYRTTGSFETAMNYLKQKDENGNNKYYIIASCGSGLFTTGGHYVVLVADTDGTITVYDPYLYSGKFNTSSRRNAGVTVSGNSVYVSENSFKTYANYKNFWIFSNDNGNTNTTTSNKNTVNYKRYVSTQNLNLNVRSGPGINYSKTSSLQKGVQVTVVEVKGEWSKITNPVSGWVNTSYLSSSSLDEINSTNQNISTISKESTEGQYKRLANRTTLYSNSNLTGTKYQYLPLTQVKIIKNISTTVDYVYIVKTGRYAYVKTNAYK